MRRAVPFFLLAVLLVGAGGAAGLGLREAPPHKAPVSSPAPGKRSKGSTPAAPTTLPGPTTTPGGDVDPAVATLEAAVVDGRFVAPVTVGQMTVEPAPSGTPGAPLGLDAASAAAEVGYSGLDGYGSPTIGFGLVTVEGVAAPAGTPSLSRTPAWVGVVLDVSGGVVNCPAEEPNSAVPVPFPPEDKAVVFYGQTGVGADLFDTGGTDPCAGTFVPPTLSQAFANVPVAWQQAGPAGLTTPISYQAPACSFLRSVSSSGSGGVFTVTVTVGFPFSRIGCGTVQTFTTSVSVYPSNLGPGAPAPPASVELVPSTAPDAVPPGLVGPLVG